MALNYKRILVGVDGSENADRSVAFVADLFASLPGVQITLLHVIPEPSEDYFATAEERQAWIEDERKKIIPSLEAQRRVLLAAGFQDREVDARVAVLPYPSVADAILAQQRLLDCGTVIVGRRGISKREEFLLGSTSSKILHAAKECALIVVE